MYQTVTRSPAAIRYQRSASNSPSSTTHGDPVRQRGDDAVGRPGHPARVGGAPEDVLGVQVEGEPRRSRGGRRPPRGRGPPLRRPGRAAGEVQQRQARPGRSGGSPPRSAAAASSARAGRRRRSSGSISSGLADQQHVAQGPVSRSRRLFDLAAEKGGGRDQRHGHRRGAGAARSARARRPRRVGEKTAPRLSVPKRRDVQLRDPAGQSDEDTLAAVRTRSALKHVGEAVGLLLQPSVGQLANTRRGGRGIASPPPMREWPLGVPVDRLISDVRFRPLANRQAPFSPAPRKTPFAWPRSRACSVAGGPACACQAVRRSEDRGAGIGAVNSHEPLEASGKSRASHFGGVRMPVHNLAV